MGSIFLSVGAQREKTVEQNKGNRGLARLPVQRLSRIALLPYFFVCHFFTLRPKLIEHLEGAT